VYPKGTMLSPQSDTEKLIATIWCRHLRTESVGLADNFFALGGDSLMAIRITSELNRSGLPFRPADIFEFQTIAQLSQIDFSAREVNNSDSEIVEKAEPFSTLSDGALQDLSSILKKNRSS